MTRLEAMRLQRNQREREISAPLESRIVDIHEWWKGAEFRANRLQATINRIQDALGSKIIDYIIEKMSYDLASRLNREIEEAVFKVRPQNGWDDIYFNLSPATLASLDPESLVNKVRDQFRSRRIVPRGVFNKISTGTAFRIDIPSLSIEEVIWNDPE